MRNIYAVRGPLLREPGRSRRSRIERSLCRSKITRGNQAQGHGRRRLHPRDSDRSLRAYRRLRLSGRNNEIGGIGLRFRRRIGSRGSRLRSLTERRRRNRHKDRNSSINRLRLHHQEVAVRVAGRGRRSSLHNRPGASNRIRRLRFRKRPGRHKVIRFSRRRPERVPEESWLSRPA
jgi:hypothetical protein